MEVDKVDESRGITQAKISVRPGETSSVEIENLAAVVPESNQKTVQVFNFIITCGHFQDLDTSTYETLN